MGSKALHSWEIMRYEKSSNAKAHYFSTTLQYLIWTEIYLSPIKKTGSYKCTCAHTQRPNVCTQIHIYIYMHTHIHWYFIVFVWFRVLFYKEYFCGLLISLRMDDYNNPREHWRDLVPLSLKLCWTIKSSKHHKFRLQSSDFKQWTVFSMTWAFLKLYK